MRRTKSKVERTRENRNSVTVLSPEVSMNRTGRPSQARQVQVQVSVWVANREGRLNTTKVFDSRAKA